MKSNKKYLRFRFLFVSEYDVKKKISFVKMISVSLIDIKSQIKRVLSLINSFKKKFIESSQMTNFKLANAIRKDNENVANSILLKIVIFDYICSKFF